MGQAKWSERDGVQRGGRKDNIEEEKNGATACHRRLKSRLKISAVHENKEREAELFGRKKRMKQLQASISHPSVNNCLCSL